MIMIKVMADERVQIKKKEDKSDMNMHQTMTNSSLSQPENPS